MKSEPDARPLQYFSDEYLEQCSKLSPLEIVTFLENFRILHGELNVARKIKTRLISIKISEPLLALFRAKASLEGIRYQTQIKNLMRQWLGLKD